MKTVGIMILLMIVLGDAKVHYKDPSQQEIESKDVPDGLSCEGRCTWECLPLAVIPNLYIKCVRGCCRSCCKHRSNVLECRSHCTNTSAAGIYLFLYKIIFFIIL
ncbi:hypothetical protein V8G54_036889 [Vigna mungo]|uniref:Uncharacterized protein n=1 Tax=Vigna mungo TaxID=3915 RepID=A0AAQ3RH05_VIGMU